MLCSNYKINKQFCKTNLGWDTLNKSGPGVGHVEQIRAGTC